MVEQVDDFEDLIRHLTWAAADEIDYVLVNTRGRGNDPVQEAFRRSDLSIAPATGATKAAPISHSLGWQFPTGVPAYGPVNIANRSLRLRSPRATRHADRPAT